MEILWVLISINFLSANKYSEVLGYELCKKKNPTFIHHDGNYFHVRAGWFVKTRHVHTKLGELLWILNGKGLCAQFAKGLF